MRKIKTKRLYLTPLSAKELREVKKAEDDRYLKRTYSRMLDDVEDDPRDYLWHTLWQIREKGTDEIVGGLNFMGAPENGGAEISFMIEEPYRGKGYAAEAVEAAVEWAFSNTRLYFIFAEIEEDNHAARGVLQKLYFKHVENGTIGPRYVYECRYSVWRFAYMALGLALGLTLGYILENIIIIASVGVAGGTAFGLGLDIADRQRRKKYRKILMPNRLDAKKDEDGE